jgi:hypothetical protein
MNIERPHIILKGIQIKSLKKARLLAKHLSVIEEEFGIHEVKITLKDIFVCYWLDLSKLDKTPMERLLSGILGKFKKERK